jgi:hypothetical protein
MLTPSANTSGATDGELNPIAKPKRASTAMRRPISLCGLEIFAELVAVPLYIQNHEVCGDISMYPQVLNPIP